jgi:hypothetical protein
VSGSAALVGGCVGGIISKDSNNVRCSASESQTGQPSVPRRCTRAAIRWLLLSIDRTGLSGVSRQDAPLFEIDDLSGATEPTTIVVLSNRRNGRLSFLQVDCGALQLAGNWPA